MYRDPLIINIVSHSKYDLKQNIKNIICAVLNTKLMNEKTHGTFILFIAYVIMILGQIYLNIEPNHIMRVNDNIKYCIFYY